MLRPDKFGAIFFEDRKLTRNMSQVFFEMDSYVMAENHLGPTDLVQYSLNNIKLTQIASQVFMYEKTLIQRKNDKWERCDT